MKTNLFKSLLVATMAIGAMGGVNSAFAQVTSFPVSANFDDGTKGIFSAGEVVTNTKNIGTVLAAGKGLPITLDFDGDTKTEGNQPYTLKENENVTFSYTAYQGYFGGTKTTTMELKNSDGVVLVGYTYSSTACNITNVIINGKTIDGFSAFFAQSGFSTSGNANGFVDLKNNVSQKAYQSREGYNPIITFSISQSGFVEMTFNGRETKLGKTYSKTFSGQLADDVKKDISTLGFTSNVDNSDRYYAIDNFSIISEIKAVKPANYTIKYVDESSKELKTSVTRSSTVGSNVTATAADMETFYSSDKSEKYVYKSGNKDIKLAEDEASNVITLTFSKYTKFGYTINAKENGTDLGEVAKGETYSDGADIAISKFYKINNEWYETTTSPYYINIKPENKAANIEVKKSDITYFAETENLGNNIGASYNKNMSNGAYSAIKGGKTAELCELPMGEYKVTVYLYEKGERGAYIRDLNNADNNTNSLCYADINKNSSNLKEYSVTLKLYKTTKIGLSGWTNSGGTNQSAGLDYIYIQRTGDATETVSVSDAGFATYATKYNVEVPNDKNVKVMTVTVNEGNSTITLHEIPAKTVIPANTGILVKAAKGNHDFVVTSKEGAKLENNSLIAATTDVTSDGSPYFALTKIGEKVGFALVEKDVVIPAGKAYLEVPGKTAAKFFSLDGEATGINSVKTAKVDGAYYTLEGVKTTKPVKGLYIHNGKKIVVK